MPKASQVKHPSETELRALYRAKAQACFHKEGQLEIDPGALVSLGEDYGAYVQAWVWVSNEDFDAATQERYALVTSSTADREVSGG